MYRNWKGAAVVGMAALLGCMMPTGTMLAAEEKSVSENDVSYGDENMPDGESVDAIQGVSILTAAAEPNMETQDNDDDDDDDDENDENDASEEVNAPKISITRGGDKALPLGDAVAFEYTNNRDALFDVGVEKNGREVLLFYCLEPVTDREAEAKKEADMSSLTWEEIQTPPMTIKSQQDGCYVVYVKAVAGTKTYYARSGGIVVDTKQPVIKGVEEGETYPEGTLFQVEDDNLDYVLVNEQRVTPESGKYKVAANGTSCVIRAKDKADNEKTCSINVSGNAAQEPEMPEEDEMISKGGTYALKAGEKYHLTAGKWKVDGDKSVYSGDSDFYVTVDGNYTFTITK